MTTRKVFTKDVPPAGLDDELYLSDEDVASVKSATRYRDRAIKIGDANTAREMEAVAGRVLIRAMSR